MWSLVVGGLSLPAHASSAFLWVEAAVIVCKHLGMLATAVLAQSISCVNGGPVHMLDGVGRSLRRGLHNACQQPRRAQHNFVLALKLKVLLCRPIHLRLLCHMTIAQSELARCCLCRAR